LGRTFFDFARQHPVYYRMQLAMYFAPRSSEAHRAVAARNDEQYQIVEAVFVAAVKQHGNMQSRHRLFAAQFIGGLNTCIALWLNGHTELDDTLLHTLLRQFQYGIYS
jgi:TetR/AcrR family transcriptional regulator